MPGISKKKMIFGEMLPFYGWDIRARMKKLFTIFSLLFAPMIIKTNIQEFMVHFFCIHPKKKERIFT